MTTAVIQPTRTRAPLAATALASIATALLALALALTAVLSALHALHADTYAVRSNSMLPVFERGDLLITRTAGDLKVGDTVTFRKYGQLVTHRIVAPGPAAGTFRTRGDANHATDPWTITQADVVGKVRGVVPRAGFPLLALEQPVGRVLAANLLAALIAALCWALPVSCTRRTDE